MSVPSVYICCNCLLEKDVLKMETATILFSNLPNEKQVRNYSKKKIKNSPFQIDAKILSSKDVEPVQ